MGTLAGHMTFESYHDRQMLKQVTWPDVNLCQCVLTDINYYNDFNRHQLLYDLF